MRAIDVTSCLLLLSLAPTSTLVARVPHHASEALGDFDLPAQRTVPGHKVIVRSAGPFASDALEATVFQILRDPCPFQWNEHTTLVDLKRDLSKRVPTEIDVRSAKDIGIDPKEPIYPELSTRRNSRRTPANSSVDPFANVANQQNQGRLENEIFQQSRETIEPWWNRTKRRSVSRESSMAGRLFLLLNRSEMTLTIWSGQLMITTVEAAEERPMTKIYDVTPLVEVNVPERHIGERNLNPAAFCDDSLVSAIQILIDPDTWEALGGPSSHQIITVGDRHWFAVSTKLTTHWKIEALLNRLNDAPNL